MAKLSLLKAHVLKMIEWIERLAVLGVELSIEMSTYLILYSLLDYFSQFIANFNMNKIQASLFELLNMLTPPRETFKRKSPKSSLLVGPKC